MCAIWSHRSKLLVLWLQQQTCSYEYWSASSQVCSHCFGQYFTHHIAQRLKSPCSCYLMVDGSMCHIIYLEIEVTMQPPFNYSVTGFNKGSHHGRKATYLRTLSVRWGDPPPLWLYGHQRCTFFLTQGLQSHVVSMEEEEEEEQYCPLW